MLSILTLMENKQSENLALCSEHGLSFYVDADGRRILFDCGPSGKTMANAHRLGVDLRAVDFTVCSHSHTDHAGGYRDLVEAGMGGKTLYTGPGFWDRKYEIAANGLKFTDLGAGFSENFLRKNNIEQKVVSGIEKISETCWLVGDFPRVYDFETVPAEFVKGNPPDVEPDDFSDEICLAVKTEKGLVVVVGCSHPGIANMVHKVHDALKQPVYAVLGGTHLIAGDAVRIEKTIDALLEMGVTILGFCHCSGKLAEEILAADSRVQTCHLAPGDCFAVK